MWKNSKISKLIFMSSLVKHDMHILHLLYYANNIAIKEFGVTWQSLGGGILPTERQKSCRPKPGETSTHPTHELHPPKTQFSTKGVGNWHPLGRNHEKSSASSTVVQVCSHAATGPPKIFQHCSMSACITEKKCWPVCLYVFSCKIEHAFQAKKGSRMVKKTLFDLDDNFFRFYHSRCSKSRFWILLTNTSQHIVATYVL